MRYPLVWALGAAIGFILIALLIAVLGPKDRPLGLEWNEIPTNGPGGRIVALGRDRVFRWDGQSFSCAPTVHGDPNHTFDLGTVRSVFDFFSEETRPTTGIRIDTIDSISVSPSGSRLVISARVFLTSGRGFFNDVVIDVDDGTVWGLYPRSVNKGLVWGSDDEVFVWNWSSYIEIDLRFSTAIDVSTGCPGSMVLPNGSHVGGPVWCTENQKGSSTVTIWEGHAGGRARRVTTRFNVWYLAADASRDLWFAIGREHSVPGKNRVLIAVDPDSGRSKVMAELPLQRYGGQFVTFQTIADKDYVLATFGDPIDSRLFEIH